MPDLVALFVIAFLLGFAAVITAMVWLYRRFRGPR